MFAELSSVLLLPLHCLQLFPFSFFSNCSSISVSVCALVWLCVVRVLVACLFLYFHYLFTVFYFIFFCCHCGRTQCTALKQCNTKLLLTLLCFLCFASSLVCFTSLQRCHNVLRRRTTLQMLAKRVPLLIVLLLLFFYYYFFFVAKSSVFVLSQ